MSARLEPAALDGERSGVLDALRAFALLGILMSHVPDFTAYNFHPAQERAFWDPLGVDTQVHSALVFLIREKFLCLFALLFGVSFAVQLDSSARRGAPFRMQFGRRLAALFVMGAAHAAIWYGDILKDYAVLGLALLLAAHWPARRLAGAAALLLATRLTWPLLVHSGLAVIGVSLDRPAPDQAFAQGASGLGQGVGAFFQANLQLVSLKAQQMIYEGRFITILSMFFIGAWIGKKGLYRDLGRHRRLLLRTLAVCVPIGICAEAAGQAFRDAINTFPPTWAWVAAQSLVAVAAPALALAYASGFALAWLRLEGRFLRLLSPVGRTALTSYVTQTLVCTAAFVWLGLGRGLSAIGCLGVAVLIFAVQCVLASTWLRRFRLGPLEWLWRCATYGRIIEIRRSAVPAETSGRIRV